MLVHFWSWSSFTKCGSNGGFTARAFPVMLSLCVGGWSGSHWSFSCTRGWQYPLTSDCVQCWHNWVDAESQLTINKKFCKLSNFLHLSCILVVSFEFRVTLEQIDLSYGRKGDFFSLNNFLYSHSVSTYLSWV